MDVRPAFSPDGKEIAFLSDRGNRPGIWTMPAENGTPKRLAPATLLDGVSWSPDGARLVAAVPGPTQPRLVTIATANGSIQDLATPGPASAPAWSPGDDLIAYLEPAGASGRGTLLRFVTGDGRARTDLVAANEPAVFGNGFLAWAADGRRVAVAGLPGAAAGMIWIADLGTPLTWRKVIDLPPGVHLRGLTWSRDGSELLTGVIRWAGDIILAERTR
jgi:dipeptidyl aminopeptidase/acylaminoacyl peptidase